MEHLSLFVSGNDEEGRRAEEILQEHNLPYKVFNNLKINGKEEPPELFDSRRRSFRGINEIETAVTEYLIPTEDGYYAKKGRSVRRDRALSNSNGEHLDN